MPRIRNVASVFQVYKVLAFVCPGCEYEHAFTVGPPDGDRPRWTWNGSFDAPTFHPSLLCNKDIPEARCHSFVADGKIQFLKDCWHKLAGKTVDLPDLGDTMLDEQLPHEEDEQDGDPAIKESPVLETPKEATDEMVAKLVEKPKRIFPCRVWHVQGSLSARLVNSEPEIKSMLSDGWTDVAPTPKKPEPLGSTEHAKRVVPSK